MKISKIILCLLLVLSFAACEGSTKSTDVSMFENEYEANKNYDADESDDDSEDDLYYEEIYGEGYDEGYDDGYEKGYEEGHADGYDEGVIAGSNADQNKSVEAAGEFDNPGCPDPPEVYYECWKNVDPEQTVYVSNRSDTVHRTSSCSGMQYYRAMSAAEAYEKGYSRCHVCW